MVRVLMVKPSGIKKMNVPMIDTGIARIGMSVARQLCRNRNTTTITRMSASSRVLATSLIETSTTDTASNDTR